MSRLIITERAAQGLEHCRHFLLTHNPLASKKAGQVIAHALQTLEANPFIGRPLPDMPELRELIIPFGQSGYVGLYRHDHNSDTLLLLAFRHQKEAGYLSL